MSEPAEVKRLRAADEKGAPWKKWGPYLSERQWGTVREDYSDDGRAWEYFPHDQARSRAYRWGEDGLAGVSDDRQRLCLALALWNGRDPILKERLFGLTNGEGNHGEDVKEYYFYLDSTPTHSYMKYFYKYPQRAYPYDDLVRTNRSRGRHQPEYELLDTGVFDDDRYFDVQVEYAKASPEELLIRIAVTNRGPEAAHLHLLPTLWFRNTWMTETGAAKPNLKTLSLPHGVSAMAATHPDLGQHFLYCDGAPPLLFTENETNVQRIAGQPNTSPYVKDGINDFVVHGRRTVNPEGVGTKAAAHYELTIGAGKTRTIRLRLTDAPPHKGAALFGRAFDATLASRLRETDDFYRSITPASAGKDTARVVRQALGGMLWSKQFYNFDLARWLREHGVSPLGSAGRSVRNREWFHMVNEDVISMPDKWEYPWYAAWDLAFHTMALGMVDPAFAKQQLDLMLTETYLHPSGQIPAYEWAFGDVNPPVHAWAAYFLYSIEREFHGRSDTDFLKRIFTKLMLNFTWWVNRKDSEGNNVFEGGFLGLDNIGVFDRSAPLPTGGHLEQADGTAWMALFCQNMLQIAMTLAEHDRAYEPLATKFVEHFLWIASALNRTGADALWDEEDGFYYDLLRYPDGSARRLKVRSMVGLLPLAATTIVEKSQRDRAPRVVQRLRARLARMPELLASVHPSGAAHLGVRKRGIIAVVNGGRLRRILNRMLDENEFLSPYGLRAISRWHADHPYVLGADGKEYRVDYQPAESASDLFGGNSNWRGPVWFPVNVLMIRALMHFYLYYGDSFKVECPTGSGKEMNLFEVARELSERLTRIFLRDAGGRRPVFGAAEKFQTDPHWRDHLLFYEYFHGETGAGLGASHQTGWTGLVARLIQIFGRADPKAFLEGARALKTDPRGKSRARRA